MNQCQYPTLQNYLAVAKKSAPKWGNINRNWQGQNIENSDNLTHQYIVDMALNELKVWTKYSNLLAKSTLAHVQ